MTAPKYRPMTFGNTRVVSHARADGCTILAAEKPLSPYAERVSDRLIHWAQHAPQRSYVARRQALADGTTGDWQHINYAQALATARSIGQALLDRGLNDERPVAILSENSLEHAMMALACLYAGVPYCPVSTAYSLVSQDFEKLRHVLAVLTPGLVLVSDAAKYSKALLATVAADCEIVAVSGTLEDRATTAYTALAATQATPAVDAAQAAISPKRIAKFLFTSGSTKLPKGVVNTHRMMCANQQQITDCMPDWADPARPPVLLDWLPWNHTFGGNHNVGIVLNHGGTLYIDDGKPVSALMDETLRNLREIAPTVYFNVPTGFEAIANAMKTDAVLRKNLLSKVWMMFYSGAGLGQPIWDSLHSTQAAEIGERIVMTTGLGMTESAPFALFVTSENVKSGDIGIPTTGMEIKLVPMADKIEVRYKGPNVTPGYWRAPEATAEAFDEEGYFCSGDAVKWIDANDIHKGLAFDGRVAEDFKLSTGTFVSVGPLCAKIIAAANPIIHGVAIAGINQKEVGVLIFPNLAACKALAGLPASATPAQVIAHDTVRSKIAAILIKVNETATGSASRVARALLLDSPPSIDKGEITDKGSLNQRAILNTRAAQLVALYDDATTAIIRPA
jgi:feruloyl-CoA synthase